MGGVVAVNCRRPPALPRTSKGSRLLSAGVLVCSPQQGRQRSALQPTWPATASRRSAQAASSASHPARVTWLSYQAPCSLTPTPHLASLPALTDHLAHTGRQLQTKRHSDSPANLSRQGLGIDPERGSCQGPSQRLAVFGHGAEHTDPKRPPLRHLRTSTLHSPSLAVSRARNPTDTCDTVTGSPEQGGTCTPACLSVTRLHYCHQLLTAHGL